MVYSGISTLIGPILTIFVKDLKDYLLVYLIGVAPSIASLILAIFIKTDRFEIKHEQADIIEKIEDDKLIDV